MKTLSEMKSGLGITSRHEKYSANSQLLIQSQYWGVNPQKNAHSSHSAKSQDTNKHKVIRRGSLHKENFNHHSRQYAKDKSFSSSIKKNRYYYLSLIIYVLISLLFCIHIAHAESSMDLFSGKDSVLLETLKGTGKKYIYLSEGLLSIATYIKSKNVMVLFGIVIVSFFFNALIQVAGVN